MSWLLSSLPIPGWNSTPKEPAGNSEEEEEDDTPPQFPLPGSAQRSAPSAAPASLAVPGADAPSFALAPPSPTVSNASSSPPTDLNIAIVDAPLGDMRLPHSTTKRPEFGIKAGGGLEAGRDAQSGKGGMPPPPPPLQPATSSLQPATSNLGPRPSPVPARLVPASSGAKKKRGKVALAPGHSALDWARLTKSGVNLRGIPPGPPRRVTMDELKQHKSRDDAWSAFNGVVYNITPYLPFHPGGEDELMRVAGRDGTKLFMLTHSWVNMEHLMAECMVGMLVRG